MKNDNESEKVRRVNEKNGLFCGHVVSDAEVNW